MDKDYTWVAPAELKRFGQNIILKVSQCLKRKNLSIIEQILSFYVVRKKLIELFQIYDSNCSIFSKELNCFDRQLGFKKFKTK